MGEEEEVTQTVKPSFINMRSTDRCDLLFWGEAPGADEAEAGRAFVGASRQEILDDWIGHEFADKRIVLDNVVPEVLDGGHGKPNADLYRKYEDYRLKQIKKYKPKVMVVLGGHATKALGIRALGGVINNAGRVHEFLSTPVVCGIHPAYFLRNDGDGIEKLEYIAKSVHSCLRRRQSKLVERIRSIQQMKAVLEQEPLLAFDIETSTLDPKDEGARLLCAAFATKKKGYWFPLYHSSFDWRKAQLFETVMYDLWSSKSIIAHNAKFETRWMRAGKLGRPFCVSDTMLLMALYDENQPKGLDHGVTNYLNEKPYWTHLPESGSYEDVPLDELGEYCALDAYYTYQLYEWLKDELTEQEMLIHDQMLAPLALTLEQMETNGIYVDQELLGKMIKREERTVRRLTNKFETEFEGINPRSPKQMQELLYETLKLKPFKWTGKENNPSTDKEVLAHFAKEVPALEPLAEAKTVRSRLSRVLVPWREKSATDGLIHSSFNLGHVVTWRLASTGPNMQNLDRQEEDRVRGGTKGGFRKALVSRFKGGCITYADYSGFEARGYAAIAGDMPYLTAFRAGLDPHLETKEAIAAGGCDLPRSTAKNCSFATIYFGYYIVNLPPRTSRLDFAASTLRDRYDVPMDAGRAFITTFLEKHPALEEWSRETVRFMKEHGYVINPFGVKRHFTEFNNHAKRQAINFLVQSFCVMICHRAAIKINERLIGMRSKLVLQTHDSLETDTHPREKRKVKQIMEESMLSEDYLELIRPDGLKAPIPLAIDIEQRENI